MAIKGMEYIKVIRRSDGVVFIIGRDVLEAEPHRFEEVFPDIVKEEDTKPTEELVLTPPEEPEEITVDDDGDDDEMVSLPNTVEEYQVELKKMGIKFHPATGLKKLMVLYNDNL